MAPTVFRLLSSVHCASGFLGRTGIAFGTSAPTILSPASARRNDAVSCRRRKGRTELKKPPQPTGQIVV